MIPGSSWEISSSDGLAEEGISAEKSLGFFHVDTHATFRMAFRCVDEFQSNISDLQFVAIAYRDVCLRGIRHAKSRLWFRFGFSSMASLVLVCDDLGVREFSLVLVDAADVVGMTMCQDDILDLDIVVSDFLRQNFIVTARIYDKSFVCLFSTAK